MLKKIFGAIGGFFKRIFKPGEKAKGVDSVKKRMETLKKRGINNQAMKVFDAYSKLFKGKYGRDIFSRNLTEEAKEEAEDIINMFLANPSSSLELINLKYSKLKDDGLVKEVEDIADKAKQIDIYENMERAKVIYDNIKSPAIKDSWNTFKNGNYTKEDVQLMKDAIQAVADRIDEDGTASLLSGAAQIDMILDEFNKMLEEYHGAD